MFHDELLRIWREPQAQVPSLVSRQAELLPSTTQPPQLITGVGVSWRESEHSVLRGGENARPPKPGGADQKAAPSVWTRLDIAGGRQRKPRGRVCAPQTCFPYSRERPRKYLRHRGSACSERLPDTGSDLRRGENRAIGESHAEGCPPESLVWEYHQWQARGISHP